MFERRAGIRTHLYSLWIKAVWTILGWWTAGAAAAGICAAAAEADTVDRCVLGSAFVGVGSELSGGDAESRLLAFEVALEAGFEVCSDL